MMGSTKKRWRPHLYLEFYLSVPLLSIQARLFKQAYDRIDYDICRLQIKLWHWHWEFNLHKQPEF